MTTIRIPTGMSEQTFAALASLGFRSTDPDGIRHFSSNEERRASDGPTEQEVILPEGWIVERKKSATNWWNVRDENGYRRGHVDFGALEDGGGELMLYTRYVTRDDYRPTGKHPFVYEVVDRRYPKQSLYTSARFPRCGIPEAETALAEVHAWLDEQFPEWRDPTKYWSPTPIAGT